LGHPTSSYANTSKNINFKGKKRSLQQLQLNLSSIINDTSRLIISPTVANLLPAADPEIEPSTEPQVAKYMHTQPLNYNEYVIISESDEVTQLHA